EVVMIDALFVERACLARSVIIPAARLSVCQAWGGEHHGGNEDEWAMYAHRLWPCEGRAPELRVCRRRWLGCRRPRGRLGRPRRGARSRSSGRARDDGIGRRARFYGCL